MINVVFHHAGQVVNTSIQAGDDLLTAARQAGVLLESPCNGNGTCGKCKVKILSSLEKDEIVLACHTKVDHDVVVEIIERHDSDNLQIKQDGLANSAEIDS